MQYSNLGPARNNQIIAFTGVLLCSLFQPKNLLLIQGSSVEKVLLLTDHPYPKVTLLSLSLLETGVRTLLEDGVIDLQEPGAQPSEFLTDIVVNLSATIVVAICYARRLKVILVENHRFGDNFDVS